MNRFRFSDFLPPRETPIVVTLTRLISRWTTRLFLGIHTVAISNEDLDRLRSFVHHRAMLLPNHPTGPGEPATMFEVVRRVGFRPFFLTAREVFEEVGAFCKTIMQRLGCYSIRRGVPDRPSMEMTRRLLARGRCVVIFPEGESCGLNDVLLPFHNGIAQMAFWALDDLRRMSISDPLYLVPIGIKYVYLTNMTEAIEESLKRMERKLGLPADNLSTYQRLRRIGEMVVTGIEKENGLRSNPNTEFSTRIEALRQFLIANTAERLSVKVRDEWTLPETLRAFFNAGNEALYALSHEFAGSPEQQRRTQAVFHAFHIDLARLYCFIAVRDGYVGAHPTAERYCDMLRRLELEVLGRIHLRGPRKAVVKVGEPINFQEHYADYRRNKRQMVAAITEELEHRVSTALNQLGAHCVVAAREHHTSI